MGKGGRSGSNGGGKGGSSSTPAEVDDDALLDAAIADANEQRAAGIAPPPEAKGKKGKAKGRGGGGTAAAAEPAGQVLTMQETLAKLDRVMAFTIAKVKSDGSKDICPSDGKLLFFTDAEDAKAELQRLQAADKNAQLCLDSTPLGRAFALTQGLMGLTSPIPAQLRFSSEVVAEVGEAGVPSELRERMRGVGPYPLMYSDKLGAEHFTPVFFTRADLTEFWCNTGGTMADVPAPTVTDLRVVVARTLQEPGQWEPLHYIPSKRCEPLTRELVAKAEKATHLTEAFASGAQRLKAVAHAAAVADGDEPPALA